MPIKAYVGMPRAGKSYEVVVNVILPALRQGRRVVSNIAGLKYDEFCQILFREGFAQEQIGELVLIKHDQVKDPYFWRTDTDQEEGRETFLQPGDQLALDEIWRFFKKRGEIHERAMNFFRMHGHMTHPQTGYTCEIALITQSVRDINENIKDVVQETFQMVKNTKIGSDKSYIVHVFARGSTSKADFIRTLAPKFYDAQYFPLYKSHSQHKEGDAKAQEKNPDDRANLLKGALIKVGLPIALLLLLLGIFGVWRFFHPAIKPDLAGKDAPPVAQNSPGAAAPVKPSVPPITQDWRVAGFYQAGASITVALVSNTGAIRLLVNPPRIKRTALGVEVELPEGGFAVSWSSPSKERGLI